MRNAYSVERSVASSNHTKTRFTLLLVLAFSWGYADVELGGVFQGNLKMKLFDEQKFIQKETWLRLKLRNHLNPARFYSNVDIRYDPIYHESPTLSIKEAYADLALGSFDLRFGKQIVIWGRADEFNPTDFINPEDYREFIFLEKADRKIGLFYPKLDYYWGNFKFEAIFIPFFTAAELPMDTTNPWIHYQIKEMIDPKIIVMNPQMPERKLENSEFALKFGAMLSGIDFSLCYFDGFFDRPVMFRENVIPPDTIVIAPEYKRFRAVGLDFATSIEKLGIRGEVAYVDNAYYITNDLHDADGIAEKPNVSSVLGADYTLFGDLYANLQWVFRFIFDYEDSIEEDEIEQRLVFTLTKTFLDEEMELGISGMVYNIVDKDYMLQPYIEYSLTDGVFLESGLYLFGGEEKTMFGQFTDNDCLYLKAAYYF